MRAVIAHHTGHPIAQVVADVGRDRWFDAEQAKAYGFVDHVVTSLDQVLPRRSVRHVGVTAR
jgi:ATP-dependent Clp protease, protease subunit